MTQTVDFPAAGPLDPDDAADAIRDAFASFCSTHLGATRPAYITKGGFWAKDVSSTIVEVYFYDGASDILVFYFNPTTHVLTAATLADNQVTLAKLAQISTARILGRTTAGSGNVESLTAAQVLAMLDAFTGDSGAGGIKGLVPAPASGDGAALKSLHADGTWKLASGVPPGVMADHAGASAPTGWLLCYGQAVSRATYAALYAEIGDTYGAGNGSTTFNLPDCRGRVSAGQDDMGGSSANRLTGLSGGVDGDTLGATGGAESHTLITTEMPSHSHTVAPSTGGTATNARVGGGPATTPGSVATSAAGGGGAHNNVQPTIILNKIIKT